MPASDRKQAQETLGWSERRLRQLVEKVEDYAILITNLEGNIEAWNIGAQRLFGFTAEEAIGQYEGIIFTPEDRAENVPEKEMKRARETGCANDERWHLRKDGSRFFVNGVQTALYEAGELTGYAKIARDLTERLTLEEELLSVNKNLELKIQERTSELNKELKKQKSYVKERTELLRKIVSTQEDERKRISRDLHDHLGQKLTALSLNLELLKQKCDDGELCRLIEQALEKANDIDSELDFLAWELRPASIDEFGLVVALENFAREFSRHFKIPVGFLSRKLKKGRLVPEIEINLYRIAQEALNNIAKHAQATNVSVLLEKPDKNIVLIVEDDGVGFDPKKKANRSKGLGLIGMSERAALVGGTVEIESAKGSGTTIYASVPAHFVGKEEL
ncbi:MAG TPA: PAS domain-containing sensor histidine kinase [Pyrinomonadaceae bacterium]|nr:PAS domain-containing sensor histidine kinase [Pyrinomonadaceae bacterium]